MNFLTLSALSTDPCGVRVRHGGVPRVVQVGLEAQHLRAGGHRVQGLAGVHRQKTNLCTVYEPELEALACARYKINYLEFNEYWTSSCYIPWVPPVVPVTNIRYDHH